MSRMTTKGQVTVPKRVREELGLRPGDEVDFVRENGRFVVRKKVMQSVFARYRGTSKWLVGKNVDGLIEEMRGR